MVKKIILNLFFSILILFISVILLESYFRFFSDFRYYSPRIFEKNGYIPWALLPDSQDCHYGYYGDFKVKIKINKDGLRDYDYKYGSGKKNIIFLGDSFTFGYGVNNEEVYMKTIENSLATRDLRLINCGFACGYSPDSYYVFLKKEINRLMPKMAIIGICASNDISDIQYNVWPGGTLDSLRIECPKFYIDSNHRLRYSPEYGFGGKLLLIKKDRCCLSSIKTYLRDNFYLLNFIISRIRMANFNKNCGLDLNIPDPAISDSLARERFKIAISKIRSFLEESGVEYLFMLIPSKDDFSNVTEEYAYIERYLKKSKSNYLNLLSEFKKRGISSCKIYYKYDGHWNKYGHSVVGEILSDYLKRFPLEK